MPSYHIDITNEQTILPLDEASLRRTIEYVLADRGVQTATVSIAVVDNKTIAELKARWFGTHLTTDVISFDLADSPDDSNANIDTDSDSDTDTDTGTGTDSPTNADADSPTDTDADADSKADTNTGTDSNADTCSGTDSNCGRKHLDCDIVVNAQRAAEMTNHPYATDTTPADTHNAHNAQNAPIAQNAPNASAPPTTAPDAFAELNLYLVHGLLHQLGYDDATPPQARAMHAKEDNLLTALGFGPVYSDLDRITTVLDNTSADSHHASTESCPPQAPCRT